MLRLALTAVCASKLVTGDAESLAIREHRRSTCTFSRDVMGFPCAVSGEGIRATPAVVRRALALVLAIAFTAAHQSGHKSAV